MWEERKREAGKRGGWIVDGGWLMEMRQRQREALGRVSAVWKAGPCMAGPGREERAESSNTILHNIDTYVCGMYNTSP